MFRLSKELFINKKNRFILRIVLFTLIIASAIFIDLIYNSIKRLNTIQDNVTHYYQIINRNHELYNTISNEEIKQKLDQLSPYLFKGWIDAARWLEDLRENHTPDKINFTYNILGLDYPIENDSDIAILPIEIDFKVDSSTSTTVISQFIENVSQKLEPQTVLESVNIIGNGKGVEKGSLKIRGWILQ